MYRAMMTVTLIAALAANRCIGKNNDLPWRIPSDLAHFKRVTLGHTMLMGRKTYESFGGRPLPKRPHIVLSKRGLEIDPQYADQVFVVSTIEDALSCAERLGNKLFVIGGATLFEQCIDIADEMILSEIDQPFDGDTFFPEFNRDDWYLTSVQTPKDEPIPYSIRRYRCG
jgi:dihydrofolate reductase